MGAVKRLINLGKNLVKLKSFASPEPKLSSVVYLHNGGGHYGLYIYFTLCLKKKYFLPEKPMFNTFF